MQLNLKHSSRAISKSTRSQCQCWCSVCFLSGSVSSVGEPELKIQALSVAGWSSDTEQWAWVLNRKQHLLFTLSAWHVWILTLPVVLLSFYVVCFFSWRGNCFSRQSRFWDCPVIWRTKRHGPWRWKQLCLLRVPPRTPSPPHPLTPGRAN